MSEEHKAKHKKEVQDLWEDIEKRDTFQHKDKQHQDEEVVAEDSEEEKEEE